MQVAKLTTEKLDIDDSNFPLQEVERKGNCRGFLL
jgi:hypothetical protein